MTNSMTGFSRSSSEQSAVSSGDGSSASNKPVMGALVWELRSVNHRYLDVQIKLPDELRSIENTVRNRLTNLVKRGKVECLLKFNPAHTHQSEIKVNEVYAGAILKACHLISKQLHQPSELNVLEVLKWPGVIEEQESDLKPVIEQALAEFAVALNNLCESRASEGQRLQVMIEERCAAMQLIVAEERKRRPQILQQTREKLLEKVAELNVSYDRDRFEQELAYIAQKMDVDEELDRLDSHFVEIKKIFEQQQPRKNQPIGRRLDFIMQEFNREANTLGAKSTDIQTTQAVLELKVLIEQMREQVQNIE